MKKSSNSQQEQEFEQIIASMKQQADSINDDPENAEMKKQITAIAYHPDIIKLLREEFGEE